MVGERAAEMRELAVATTVTTAANQETTAQRHMHDT